MDIASLDPVCDSLTSVVSIKARWLPSVNKNKYNKVMVNETKSSSLLFVGTLSVISVKCIYLSIFFSLCRSLSLLREKDWPNKCVLCPRSRGAGAACWEEEAAAGGVEEEDDRGGGGAEAGGSPARGPALCGCCGCVSGSTLQATTLSCMVRLSLHTHLYLPFLLRCSVVRICACVCACIILWFPVLITFTFLCRYTALHSGLHKTTNSSCSLLRAKGLFINRVKGSSLCPFVSVSGF